MAGRIFLILSAMFVMCASAAGQSLRWSDLDRLHSSLPHGQEDPLWRIDNLYCLGEHVCAVGGTAGERWNCDSRVSSCVGQWRDGKAGRSELWRLSDCDTLLSELNEEQAAILRNPKFCEARKPIKSALPTYSEEEAQCVADTYCREQTLISYEDCASRRLECATTLRSASVTQRNFCRARRHSDTAAGRCDLIYTPPVWVSPQDWTPPPAPDRLLIFREDEARCVAAEQCGHLTNIFEKNSCDRRYLKCTENRLVMWPDVRERCEALRTEVGELGICSLNSASASSAAAVSTIATAPPRTWQEQAERADAKADAEAEDEFSLGDIDF